MGEFLNALGEAFRNRSKVSFFRVYLTIWIVRNFSFLFALFNFDKEMDLSAKLEFIKMYFNPSDVNSTSRQLFGKYITVECFMDHIVLNLLYTFAWIGVVHICLLLTKLISTLFDRITRSGQKVLNNKGYVPVQEKFSLEKKVEELHAKNSELVRGIDTYNKKIDELNKESIELKQEIEVHENYYKSEISRYFSFYPKNESEMLDLYLFLREVHNYDYNQIEEISDSFIELRDFGFIDVRLADVRTTMALSKKGEFLKTYLRNNTKR